MPVGSRAGAPSPETPLGDSGGTRSWRWGRRLASSSPRAAARWAGDLASAGERRAAGHEEAAGRKALRGEKFCGICMSGDGKKSPS